MEWLQDRYIILLSFLPILFLVLVVFSTNHNLVWNAYQIIEHNNRLYLSQSYGPVYIVILAYAFFLIMLVEGVLVYALYKSLIFYRSFIVTMMAAGVLPVAVAYFDYLGLSPFPYFQSTPLAVGVTALTVAYNLDRIRSGDLTQVSRTTLFKQMEDVILIVDDQGRVLDINQRALDLLRKTSEEIMKRKVGEAWPEWEEIKSRYSQYRDQARRSIQFPGGDTYTISISELRDWRDQVMGEIILLQDVTAYKQRTDEISALLEINNLVSSTLDLNQVLLRMAGKLLEVSKMQRCTIAEWEPGSGIVRCLIDHSISFWGDSAESFSIKNEAIIRRVLITGQRETIHEKLGSNSKLDYSRKGTTSRTLFPLFSGSEIVGLVEVGGLAAVQNPAGEMDHCEEILLEAATWLVSPLRFNKPESLMELAKSIVNNHIGSYTTIFEWDSGANEITRVADYSELVWSKDKGPQYSLDQWPIAERVLKTGRPDVLTSHDSTEFSTDKKKLESWGSQMVVLHPLSIKSEPIGIVELFATSNDMEITGNSLRLWQTMADQAAVAIMNAKLYEQAQEEIQERTRVEQQLRYHAYHDSLTGLSNRALLLERLQGALGRSKRIPVFRFAVLFLDIDDFKNINDIYGHPTGDQLLVEIAKRLTTCVREVDTLARLGGDEFVFLIEGITDDRDITEIARRVQASLSSPFKFSDVELTTTSSIGIVINNDQYHNPEDILRDADIAMYRAKERGKARFEFFHPGMRENILSRLKLEADLHAAIRDCQLNLVYQPIVQIATGALQGCETLVRWTMEDGTIINPNKFIPIAEETGLIIQLGNWIIDQTCSQLKNWDNFNGFFKGVGASINISSVQIFQPNFIEDIERILSTYHILGDKLCLEITEGTFIKDLNYVSETIRQLKKIGLRVHLDDFGKGYSSLSYISQLPIDALKIDKYFVSAVDNPDVRGIIKFIVSMSRELGIYVIAEGIETVQQHEFLESIGCEFGQGHFYGKPIESRDFKRRYLNFKKLRSQQSRDTVDRG
jgi:diguanylate cyclase (GGDEF)-like protein/PAS domain S-box-containing protein